VLCARRQGQWSDPLFVTLRGGRFGWQIDAQTTDLVLMFMTPESLAALLDGPLTLGEGFAVARGPVGRPPAKATDESRGAKVYVYASSRAPFEPAVLEGAVLQVVDRDNRVYYGGRDLGAWRILGGEVESVPVSAERLKARLAEMTE
jgi:lipid-binding SYLF domain-containing protein